jgi:magnesium-transporting ATPase (P-type)
VLGQVFFLINCRSLYASSLSPRLWFTNPAIWIASGALALLQALFVYAPVMNLWFRTVPLAARDWLLPVAIGSAILLLVESDKAVARWLKPMANPSPAAGTGDTDPGILRQARDLSVQATPL